MKLLVRNLARTTTAADLRSLFEAYGSVQSCTLVTEKETGRSKGFGFVVMPKPGDAKAARKNLNGIEVAGNRIRVKNAATRPDGAKPDEKSPVEDLVAASEAVIRTTPATENVDSKDDSVKKHDAEKKDAGQNRNIWKK